MNDQLEQLRWVRALARDGRARGLRLRAGLSLGEVAAAAGVARSSVHRWETAQRTPRGEAAARYAEILRDLQEPA